MKTNIKYQKSGLQGRPEQLNTAKTGLARINLARRMANRSLTTERLLGLLRKQSPRFFELAEVVGKWVWIQFERKQPNHITSVLAELGFHWNKTRQAWQHPCRVYCAKGAAYDPRTRYGSYFAADILHG